MIKSMYIYTIYIIYVYMYMHAFIAALAQDCGPQIVPHSGLQRHVQGYHESRRCSRDTFPESYITKYTSI